MATASAAEPVTFKVLKSIQTEGFAFADALLMMSNYRNVRGSRQVRSERRRKAKRLPTPRVRAVPKYWKW